MDALGAAANRIGRKEAEPHIAELLKLIPDRWADVDIDSLSDPEARVLYWLTAAGLVERRVQVRVGKAGDTSRIVASLTATGEYGWGEAMKPLCAEYAARFGDGTPVCEAAATEQWRLTADGCNARSESQGGDPFVADFVLKDRTPPMMHRPPVRGYGKMLRLEFRDGDDLSNDVRVVNWDEGAAAIAAAMQPEQPASETNADDDGDSDGDNGVAGGYVTLLQMAAIVSESKRTLERRRSDGKLPDPDVPGGSGKAHKWSWQKVRPILEKLFDRKLPEQFPHDRFVLK